MLYAMVCYQISLRKLKFRVGVMSLDVQLLPNYDFERRKKVVEGVDDGIVVAAVGWVNKISPLHLIQNYFVDNHLERDGYSDDCGGYDNDDHDDEDRLRGAS
mmetsp:Transcript_4928/g.6788  ORF Transcript_4928/g.6788 Transcript_4928/m.6788 type:complete len:102 (-) Transcript_4928:245-550(-)